MEGQKALRCHKKLNESLIGLERHERGKLRHNFHFLGELNLCTITVSVHL